MASDPPGDSKHRAVGMFNQGGLSAQAQTRALTSGLAASFARVRQSYVLRRAYSRRISIYCPPEVRKAVIPKNTYDLAAGRFTFSRVHAHEACRECSLTG